MISKIREIATKYGRIMLAALLCVAIGFSLNVVTKSVRTYKIFDGSKTLTVRMMSDNVRDALKAVSLKSDDYEILNSNKKNGFINVKIGYKFPVNIVVGDKTVSVKTTKTTVSDVLKLAGFDIDGYDLVEPTADTVISEKCTIKYSDVDFVKGTYKEAIPCALETVYSSEKMVGDNSVIQGTDGQKEVHYTTKLVNGEKVETVVDSVVVLSNAVNGKQIIGTAKPKTPTATAVKTSNDVSVVSTLSHSPIELDANGNPIKYTKKLSVQATGYTYTGHRCSTGVAPQPGYIAVNPKVIPYGTKMYIKSADGSFTYGYAVAADTGGFIKSRPTNVDLFFATRSACVNFGRRNVEIYIIG